MTLLIAAKAGLGLRPNGTVFTFEPGIVMAADTRLSFGNGAVVDNGLKIGKVGSRAICGMSSDSIDIPTQAFHYFDIFMTDRPEIPTAEAVIELRRLLSEANHTISLSLGRADLGTTAFFGHHDPSTQRFNLYRLESIDGFTPEIRDGFNAAGSHAEWVMETFERIKHEYTTCELRPFDGFPGNRVPIRKAVAPFVMTIIDAALEVARREEALNGPSQGIGGTVQAAIVTTQGANVANPVWNETLKAWQIFERRLE